MTSNIFNSILLLGLASLMFIDISFSILFTIVFMVSIISNFTILLDYKISLFIFNMSLKRIKYSKANDKYYTYIKIDKYGDMIVYLSESKLTYFKLINKIDIGGVMNENNLGETIKKYIDDYEKKKEVDNVFKNKAKRLTGQYKGWDGILTKEDKRDNTINSIIK